MQLRYISYDMIHWSQKSFLYNTNCVNLPYTYILIITVLLKANLKPNVVKITNALGQSQATLSISAPKAVHFFDTLPLHI